MRCFRLKNNQNVSLTINPFNLVRLGNLFGTVHELLGSKHEFALKQFLNVAAHFLPGSMPKIPPSDNVSCLPI